MLTQGGEGLRGDIWTRKEHLQICVGDTHLPWEKKQGVTAHTMSVTGQTPWGSCYRPPVLRQGDPVLTAGL